MILDQSKVSVNNSGLGFNSVEHSKNHPPTVMRVVKNGLFKVEPPKPSKTVFRSAGFAQPQSSKTSVSILAGKTLQKVKYHCTFCDKGGHSVEFCFRRAKVERKERLSALRSIRGVSSHTSETELNTMTTLIAKSAMVLDLLKSLTS